MWKNTRGALYRPASDAPAGTYSIRRFEQDGYKGYTAKIPVGHHERGMIKVEQELILYDDVSHIPKVKPYLNGGALFPSKASAREYLEATYPDFLLIMRD
jgi:hypothetical protein